MPHRVSMKRSDRVRIQQPLGLCSSLGLHSVEGKMRDVYELLREKAHAIEQVRREVEALRSVAGMVQE